MVATAVFESNDKAKSLSHLNGKQFILTKYYRHFDGIKATWESIRNDACIRHN